MNPPLIPPPQSDSGAWTYPRQLLKWLDVNPITPYTRAGTYLTLPSFNVSAAWEGMSDIVCTFNVEAPNNFSIQSYTAPTGANYALCISCLLGGNVVRYVLWDAIGSNLNIAGSVAYNGQPIKKNFRFEIWSTSQGNASQATPINFNTSVLQNIDYRYAQNALLKADDGAVTSLHNINGTVPAPSFVVRFSAKYGKTLNGSNILTAWTDTLGGSSVTLGGGSIVYAAPYLVFSASNTASPVYNGNGDPIYLMFRLGTINTTTTIYSNNSSISLTFNSGSKKFVANTVAGTYVEASFGRTYLAVFVANLCYIYDSQTLNLLDTITTATSVNPYTSSTIGNSAAQFEFYELIESDDSVENIIAYLNQEYSIGAFTFPITFAPNNVSQSN